MLAINCESLYLNENLSKEIEVSWSFRCPVNLIDWIGMFELDESNPLKYMEYKSFGVCGSQNGSVSWTLSGVAFQNRPQTYVCFRYFDGLNGLLRASSPPLLVYTAARIVIDEIFCSKLASKNISAYVKIRYGSSSYRTYVSEAGLWNNLNFTFSIDYSQELELELKERYWSGDRSIGQINVGIAELATRSNQRVAYVLRPSDYLNQFEYQIFVTVHVVPEQHDLIDSEGNVLVSREPLNKQINVSVSNDKYMVMRYCNASTSHSRWPIPEGWEARVDKHGRVFYLDHKNRRSTWHLPGGTLQESSLQGENARRIRYTCARRTVINKLSTEETDVSPLDFLQRVDFMNLLHANIPALELYNESRSLKHIVHHVRKDASKYDKFKNNTELVTFLNLFADDTQPLPKGWQITKKSDYQKYFVDHEKKRTTLIDPRLPSSVKRARSAPPIQRNQDCNGNMLNDILHRNGDLQAIVNQKMPHLAPKICRKLQLIGRHGPSALARFSNDLELVAALSLLEDDIQAKKTDFQEKVQYFYASLEKSGYGQSPGKIKFRLRRSHLLADAFDQILSADAINLRKKKLSVTFDEEDGLDYGGPSRELFFLLSRQLFNPCSGLFEYSSDMAYTVEISPISIFIENHLKWMELCGRVLGLALTHRCLIDTFFAQTFYKRILEKQFNMEDLSDLDTQFYNSLLWIRDNEISEDMGFTFSVTENSTGKIIEKELLPSGGEIKVNETNKREFINLMTNWRIERGVGEQTAALHRGLYDIVQPDCLRIFNSKQLDSLLSGTFDIDIDDWKQNTEYKNGYFASHICMEWFWDIVYEMKNADRLKLLQFVTGTSSIPYEGFQALRGSSGPKKFTIEKWGEEESLPRAHTCFNRLDLPCYSSKHKMKMKIKFAIEESDVYAIE